MHTVDLEKIILAHFRNLDSLHNRAFTYVVAGACVFFGTLAVLFAVYYKLTERPAERDGTKKRV